MDVTTAMPPTAASHSAKHAGPAARKAAGQDETPADPFTALLAELLAATVNVPGESAASVRTTTAQDGTCQADGKRTPFSAAIGSGTAHAPEGTSPPLAAKAANDTPTPTANNRSAAPALEAAPKADMPAPIPLAARPTPLEAAPPVLAADATKQVTARTATAAPAATPSVPATVTPPADPRASSATPNVAPPVALDTSRPAEMPAESAFRGPDSGTAEPALPRAEAAPATPVRGSAAVATAAPIPPAEPAGNTAAGLAKPETPSVQPTGVAQPQPSAPSTGRPDAAVAAQDNPAPPPRTRDTRAAVTPPPRISEAVTSARDAIGPAATDGTPEATPETPVSGPGGAHRPSSIPLQSAAAAGRLAEQIAYMAQRDLQHATIQVDPAELGPIQIRVTLGGHDQLQIQFTAAQAQTREALEGHLPRLREVLAESGFSQLNVDVSGNPDQQRQAATHYSQEGSRQTPAPWRLPREESSQLQEAPFAARPPRAREGARLDVFA